MNNYTNSYNQKGEQSSINKKKEYQETSSYLSDNDLHKSIQYFEKMNAKTAPASWRIFTKDNILLLISGKVPEKIAKKYEQVLAAMDSQ